MKLGDHRRGDKQIEAKIAAVGFDTARNVHSVSNHGEFESALATDVTLDHMPVMNADRDPEGLLPGASALPIPSIDFTENIECTLNCVGDVVSAWVWQAEHSNQTVA
jgi:hypothetical protein